MSWITCNLGNRTKAYRDGITFLVSAEDYEDYVYGYRFSLDKNSYVIYSSTKDGLIRKRLHRILMGEPEDLVVDHINRDPLDNRRENLRIVSRQENQMNLSMKKTNKSGITGVSWHKDANKWRADIAYKYKHIYLGYFDTLEEARKAREDAEEEYFGEFKPM
tara:strand:+ start:198 stop:683 length:486 start_codon:yes stop_codon:yes gene_type:complete